MNIRGLSAPKFAMGYCLTVRVFFLSSRLRLSALVFRRYFDVRHCSPFAHSHR